MSVYKKEDIPDRFHYKHNRRIQPILAVADEGWEIVQNNSDHFPSKYMIPFSTALFKIRQNSTKLIMRVNGMQWLRCGRSTICPFFHSILMAGIRQNMSFPFNHRATFLENYVVTETTVIESLILWEKCGYDHKTIRMVLISVSPLPLQRIKTSFSW